MSLSPNARSFDSKPQRAGREPLSAGYRERGKGLCFLYLFVLAVDPLVRLLVSPMSPNTEALRHGSGISDVWTISVGPLDLELRAPLCSARSPLS